MPDDDRHDHKLTNFGTLKLEGFGPEATEFAPVSDQLHSFIHSYSFIKVGLTHCDNLKYIAKVENSVNTSL